MKTCPECSSEIPDDAQVCKACGERIEGRLCPDCLSMCKTEAKKCKWCNYEFENVVGRADFEPFIINADLLPTLVIRGRFLPQKISFNREKIIISTPGLFGLTVSEEEIPWQKVAGFDYHSGIFWDKVKIETRGQTSSVIGCLRKNDGLRIRHILQQLEK